MQACLALIDSALPFDLNSNVVVLVSCSQYPKTDQNSSEVITNRTEFRMLVKLC